MVPSLDVARYLIHLATPSENEDADCLSHLRLQKLLYYVQAWHLAARNKPLFPGRIEAWTHGPVVEEVYYEFKHYGYQSIPPQQGAEAASLSQQDKTFIQSVWEAYKRFSASALRDKTHREAPWRDARGDLGPNDRSDAEISHDAMRRFFQPRMNQWIFATHPEVKNDLWVQSRQAMEAGRVKTAQEIRRELHRRRTGTDPG
jgi:uncharacterized phage-associated protein